MTSGPIISMRDFSPEGIRIMRKKKKKPAAPEEYRGDEALEAIDAIKGAESEARQKIAAAHEKGARVLTRDVAEKVKEIKDRSQKEARSQSADRKKALVEEAGREAESIRKEAEDIIRALGEETESLIGKAVKTTAGKIETFLDGGAI